MEKTKEIGVVKMELRIAIIIQWLEFLKEHYNDDMIQLDNEELKSLEDSIIFLKSLKER